MSNHLHDHSGMKFRWQASQERERDRLGHQDGSSQVPSSRLPGRALVLDPDSPTALGAVRALGAAGWTVGVGTHAGLTAASVSKWCTARHFVARPGYGVDAFVDSINDAIDAQGYEVVFGCGDAQVFALSSCRDAIRAVVPYADDAVLRHAFDKLLQIEAARSAGLNVPETRPANDPAARLLRLPVAVKPRWHWTPGKSALERCPVSICATIESAFEAVRRIEAAGAEAVVQEFHEGWLLSFNIVMDKGGTVLAVMQQKAHEIWPPRAGTPARGVTMEVDDALAAGVVRLLRGLGWFGLVNLQFIVSEDGAARLIDFNGRPYQTQALALGAGVNFMDIWARAATGREVGPACTAKVGVRYYDFRQEMMRVVARFGWNPVELAKSLAFAVGAKHIVWSLDDPRPVFTHYRRIIRRHLTHRR